MRTYPRITFDKDLACWESRIRICLFWPSFIRSNVKMGGEQLFQ